MSGVDYANKTVEYDALCTAIYDADVQFNEDVSEVIYADYSGRAMYGAKCFGLVLDSAADAVKVLIELSHDGTLYNDRKDAVQMLADAMRSDSMGLSGIWYFPGWTLSGVPEEAEQP